MRFDSSGGFTTAAAAAAAGAAKKEMTTERPCTLQTRPLMNQTANDSDERDSMNQLSLGHQICYTAARRAGILWTLLVVLVVLLGVVVAQVADTAAAAATSSSLNQERYTRVFPSIRATSSSGTRTASTSSSTSSTSSSNSDSRLSNQDHDRHLRHRSLQGFNELICALDPAVLLVRRNKVTGEYAFDNDNDDYFRPNDTVDLGINRTANNSTNDTIAFVGQDATDVTMATSNGMDEDEENDEDNENDNMEYVRVKRCPCAELYYVYDDYCPADLNTCIVRGTRSPLTCIETSSSDQFIRTFWPVTVAALLALCYSIGCTFTGKLARQYSRRIFQCGGMTHYTAPTSPETSDDATTSPSSSSPTATASRRTVALWRDLDLLLEQEPEQAALLYRQYRLRERDRLRRLQVRHESWWYRHLYQGIVVRVWQFISCRCRRTASSNQHVADAGDGVVDTTSSPLPESAPDLRPRLTLKTKVYQAESGDFTGPIVTANGGPLSMFTSNRNDTVTLEEMDDEMESGVRCAICLTKLQTGDVVGDLYCRHVLHKDCLKDWLQRKNQCPLCQQTGIAAFTNPSVLSVPLHSTLSLSPPPPPPPLASTSTILAPASTPDRTSHSFASQREVQA